jgi:cytochrome c peroxidase
LITSKLPALQYYQLSIPAPEPPRGSFDARSAAAGKAVFNGAARCATCHVPPLFTEPGWNMHTAAEIGIDDFQSSRSPDQLPDSTSAWSLHAPGRILHDGRFATLGDVVEHYDQTFAPSY